jgi:hypothetical protein
LKTAREELGIINAYENTGSLRAAAALCGTTHRTVRRVLERRVAGQLAGTAPQAAAGVGRSVHRSDLRQGQVDRREDHREAATAAGAGARKYGFGAHAAPGGGRAEGAVEADAAGVSAVDA